MLIAGATASAASRGKRRMPFAQVTRSSTKVSHGWSQKHGEVLTKQGGSRFDRYRLRCCASPPPKKSLELKIELRGAFI